MAAPARPVSSCLRGNQKGRFELEFKAPRLDGCAPRLFHGGVVAHNRHHATVYRPLCINPTCRKSSKENAHSREPRKKPVNPTFAAQ